MLSTLTAFLFLTLQLSCSQGPHHPHAHPRFIHGGPKITQDTNLLQDKEHIQEEIGEEIRSEDVNKMSPEELEFHYFKIHDYDNNTKLDGLEILQAIRHTMEHASSTTKAPVLPPEDLAYFITLIDQVLEEDDQDRDGYLSYSEYAIGRKRDAARRASVKTS